jgi:hypothetical protein
MAQAGKWGWELKAAAHGIAQGGIAEATGGEFRHGFYSGFFTSAAASSGFIEGAPGGGAGRVAAAAVVGGTASAIGGGKFANGAVSGAFIQMFNEEADHLSASEKEYNAHIKGATRGPRVPWDESNPHYRPGPDVEGKGAFPAPPGKFLWKLRALFWKPTSVAAYVPRSTRPIYTVDLVKSGEIVDVVYGYQEQGAGFSDTIRPSVYFEISGGKNNLWTSPSFPKYNWRWPFGGDPYNVKRSNVTDPVIIDEK